MHPKEIMELEVEKEKMFWQINKSRVGLKHKRILYEKRIVYRYRITLRGSTARRLCVKSSRRPAGHC
jgi:hypothetical protein